MKFRTAITPDVSQRGLISHGSKILTLGSCFADTMACRLSADLFQVMANPTGPLFNPFSILEVINRSATSRYFNVTDMAQSPDGRWHTWHCHTALSHHDKVTAMRNANEALHATAEALQHAGMIFITLGTAWTFALADGTIVANCHKHPSHAFSRTRASVSQVAASITEMTETIAKVNPSAAVVFTVSPVRHLADGLHGNQLSKATLLLAIEQAGVDYFPAYEALMDDLRDYRFWADDMKHPSTMAADYVYSLLCDTFMDDATRAMLPECSAFTRMLSHRPHTPSAAEALSRSIILQSETLAERHPVLAPAIENIMHHGLFNQ